MRPHPSFINLVNFCNFFQLLFSAQEAGLSNSEFEQSEFQTSLTVWLLAAYLLIGNVLILNLLIAIFGHIYEVVAENSTIEWKNEMFLLCQEYSDKPVLPPPISIFETCYLFMSQLCCDAEEDSAYFTLKTFATSI